MAICTLHPMPLVLLPIERLNGLSPYLPTSGTWTME